MDPCLVSLLLAFVCSSVTLATGATLEFATLRNEPPCLQAGGICVSNGTCPPDFVANATATFYVDDGIISDGHKTVVEKGEEQLCPDQSGEGVVCCYRVPTEETRCRERGGECRTADACGRAPRQLGAECPEEMVCCTLLN